jgi:hypothetical protein
MTVHLHSSIWTLEVDDKPTLAFEAKKYREANELCHEDWLRVQLGLQKFKGVPLCRADSGYGSPGRMKWSCIDERSKLTIRQMTAIWSI